MCLWYTLCCYLLVVLMSFLLGVVVYLGLATLASCCAANAVLHVVQCLSHVEVVHVRYAKTTLRYLHEDSCLTSQHRSQTGSESALKQRQYFPLVVLVPNMSSSCPLGLQSAVLHYKIRLTRGTSAGRAVYCSMPTFSCAYGAANPGDAWKPRPAPLRRSNE